MGKTSLHITIPEPCNEDWSKMTATQCGAFCMACQKEVVDFSLMSEAEIVDRLSKASGKVCGRIATDKLNRELVKHAPDHAWYSWKKWGIAAGVLLGVSNVKAENTVAEDTTTKFTMKNTLLWPDAGERNVSDTLLAKPFVTDTTAPANTNDTANFHQKVVVMDGPYVTSGLVVIKEKPTRPIQRIRRFFLRIQRAFLKPKYRH